MVGLRSDDRIFFVISGENNINNLLLEICFVAGGLELDIELHVVSFGPGNHVFEQRNASVTKFGVKKTASIEIFDIIIINFPSVSVKPGNTFEIVIMSNDDLVVFSLLDVELNPICAGVFSSNKSEHGVFGIIGGGAAVGSDFGGMKILNVEIKIAFINAII